MFATLPDLVPRSLIQLPAQGAETPAPGQGMNVPVGRRSRPPAPRRLTAGRGGARARPRPPPPAASWPPTPDTRRKRAATRRAPATIRLVAEAGQERAHDAPRLEVLGFLEDIPASSSEPGSPAGEEQHDDDWIMHHTMSAIGAILKGTGTG